MKILFIGAGIMGKPMSLNLFKKNFKIDVFNRTYSNAKSLENEGVSVLKTLPDKLNYDVIISMIADDLASENIFFNEFNVLDKIMPSTIIIECSTLSYSYIKRLEIEINKRNCVLLDAPVIGSKLPAINATLNFYISGKTAIVNKVNNVFMAMANLTFHLSDEIGIATKAKLIMNGMIAGPIHYLFSNAQEALLGLNLEYDYVANLILSSPYVSIATEAKIIRFKTGDKNVQAKLSTIEKDLSNLNSFEKLNPVLEYIKNEYHESLDKIGNDSDVSEINLYKHPLTNDFLKKRRDDI